MDAVLDPEATPALDGALPLLRRGITSSLHTDNIAALAALDAVAQAHEIAPLLIDPQTAGGLLAGIPSWAASACVDQLRELGYGAAVIGRVTGLSGAAPRVDFEAGAGEALPEPVAAKLTAVFQAESADTAPMSCGLNGRIACARCSA